MELKSKNMTLDLEGSQIIFEGIGKDEFFELMELKGIKTQWDYILDMVVDVKGLTYEGKEVTVDEFKQANIASTAMQKISNGFFSLAKGELSLNEAVSEKNADS
jgi:hypothetical protein